MAFHGTAAFGFQGSGKESTYFSMRDKCMEGHIGTIDGEKLNVRYGCGHIGGFIWIIFIVVCFLTPLFCLQQNALQGD